MNRIYMDNAATTPPSDEVIAAMEKAMRETWGNASSIHRTGRDARKAVESARRQVAAALGAESNEIFFTSGGSESDNWAVKGAALAREGKGRHVITSAIEHHAVLHSAQWLEKRGFRVTYLPVDKMGFVRPDDLAQALTDETVLVSVMMANNEIGTIEPVRELADICHARGVPFHTDAVQAFGAIPVNVKDIQADMLSISAHKLHGPKGVGALYIKKGVRIEGFMSGGAQERGLRAGTENVPGVAGLGAAAEAAAGSLAARAQRVTALRDRLIRGILQTIPETRLNGSPDKRLPGNVNISVRYVEGEALLLRLDLAGISASSGSACTSGSLDPSHVLLAIGLPHEVAHGSLRLSLSDQNTEREVDEVLRALPPIVRDLRDMSPLYIKANAKGE